MTDLDIAKEKLYEKSLTLVMVKNGKTVYETSSHRLSGFLEAIDTLGEETQESSVADRVAGRAVALLCAYAGVRWIYAVVMSRQAKSVFGKHKIHYKYRELVDNILDSNRIDSCPFEKVSANLSDPIEAHSAFENLVSRLKQCK